MGIMAHYRCYWGTLFNLTGMGSISLDLHWQSGLPYILSNLAYVWILLAIFNMYMHVLYLVTKLTLFSGGSRICNRRGMPLSVDHTP